MSRRIGTRVMTGSGRVHVRVDGRPDGTPLVLLHGFSGSMRWWDRVVPLMAPHFRVLRVDLLGHGETGGPAADAPRQAQMVEDVLAAFEVTGGVAVGHSFGADVAVELAERSPRVTGLVVVMQAPDYSDAMLPRGNELMLRPVLGRAILGFGRTAAAGLAFVVAHTGGASPRRELVGQALHDFRAMDRGMFRVVLGDRRERMTRRPLDEQVRAAGKPTLVLLGGQDHFYGDRSAGRYVAAGARVEVFDDSGHSPLIDAPGRTARAIRDFVTATTPAG